MITLEFRDELRNSRFSTGNQFDYGGSQPLGFFYDEDKEMPLIMRAPAINIPARRTRAGRITGVDTFMDAHPEGEMHFSPARQFRGRSLNKHRISDILHYSRMPLIAKTRAGRYLVGKGFLASYSLEGEMQVLFIAMVPPGEISTKDIRCYLSRNLYTHGHRAMWAILKPIVEASSGDVTWTSDMSRFLGKKLDLPNFRTSREMRAYENELSTMLITKEREKYTQTEPSSKDKRVSKKTEGDEVTEETASVDLRSLAQQATEIQDSLGNAPYTVGVDPYRIPAPHIPEEDDLTF